MDALCSTRSKRNWWWWWWRYADLADLFCWTVMGHSLSTMHSYQIHRRSKEIKFNIKHENIFLEWFDSNNMLIFISYL
jgi:hypothetical protein